MRLTGGVGLGRRGGPLGWLAVEVWGGAEQVGGQRGGGGSAGTVVAIVDMFSTLV